MEGLEEWLASVEEGWAEGWPAALSADWFELVFRDHGPISLAELKLLLEVEEARLAVSAEARLSLARQLLPKVLADVDAVGLPRPAVRLDLDEWNALTIRITFTPDGGYTSGGNCDGALFHGDEPAALLGWLAENVQETTMEGDQVHCLVWPVCDAHNRGGHVRAANGIAVWWCGGDAGHVIAPIGGLAATVR